MDKIEQFFEQYSYLCENEFNLGYISGVSLVILVVLLLLIVRMIVKFIFRKRRAKELTVLCKDGNIVVSIEAISQTINSILANFSTLQVRDVKLIKIRKRYELNLFATFDASGKVMLPEELANLKSQLFSGLEDVFGIKSIYRIGIKIEKLSNEPDFTPAPQAELESFEGEDVEKTAEVDN